MMGAEELLVSACNGRNCEGHTLCDDTQTGTCTTCGDALYADEGCRFEVRRLTLHGPMMVPERFCNLTCAAGYAAALPIEE